MDISSFPAGETGTLTVQVSEGETLPVADAADFTPQGETLLVFHLNSNPVAVAGPDQDVECSSPDGGLILLDGSSSWDDDSLPGSYEDIVLYEWIRDFGYPSELLMGTGMTLSYPLVWGDHAIALRVTDSKGVWSVDRSHARVVDTVPPVLTVPPDLVVECQGPEGAVLDPGMAMAEDVCHGDLPVNEPAIGQFPLGTTFLTWSAQDPLGNQASKTQSVQIVDSTPPEITAYAEPVLLWPPNHRMVEIETSVGVGDLCSSSNVVLESVVSDELDDAEGNGDGRTVNDIQGVEPETLDLNLMLRAERSGTGSGRTYSINYRATDWFGNAAILPVPVFVPHNQGGVTEPVMLTVEENGSGTLVEWTEAPGAMHYNVIRGETKSLKDQDEFYHLGRLTCIASGLTDPTMAGMEDPDLPPVGEAFFYLVEYSDGQPSSYSSVSAAKPRFAPPGQGACP
jgi:hypothetical protein